MSVSDIRSSKCMFDVQVVQVTADVSYYSYMHRLKRNMFESWPWVKHVDRLRKWEKRFLHSPHFRFWIKFGPSKLDSQFLTGFEVVNAQFLDPNTACCDILLERLLLGFSAYRLFSEFSNSDYGISKYSGLRRIWTSCLKLDPRSRTIFMAHFYPVSLWLLCFYNSGPLHSQVLRCQD